MSKTIVCNSNTCPAKDNCKTHNPKGLLENIILTLGFHGTPNTEPPVTQDPTCLLYDPIDSREAFKQLQAYIASYKSSVISIENELECVKMTLGSLVHPFYISEKQVTKDLYNTIGNGAKGYIKLGD